ncbi:hypothetical protein HPB51_021086 [Rhipicephalus microplus]|uniref:Uncharacterized protein n=1 Tax=Rhipicephalus microplus TaxID=6941 RepID=A0A9J6DCB6_RHIMP|nr:hypothetical protein HPB51_021086 [Rhipicephalus microplus]
MSSEALPLESHEEAAKQRDPSGSLFHSLLSQRPKRPAARRSAKNGPCSPIPEATSAPHEAGTDPIRAEQLTGGDRGGPWPSTAPPAPRETMGPHSRRRRAASPIKSKATAAVVTTAPRRLQFTRYRHAVRHRPHEHGRMTRCHRFQSVQLVTRSQESEFPAAHKLRCRGCYVDHGARQRHKRQFKVGESCGAGRR